MTFSENNDKCLTTQKFKSSLSVSETESGALLKRNLHIWGLSSFLSISVIFKLVTVTWHPDWWVGKKQSILCCIRDVTGPPGQSDLSLKEGGSSRAAHPPAAESSYSGSYLNRSLQQTHNQHFTQTMPRPPEIMCQAWIAQDKHNFEKQLKSYFPYIVTLWVWTIGSFPQNEHILLLFPGDRSQMPPIPVSSFHTVWLYCISLISASIGLVPRC